MMADANLWRTGLLLFVLLLLGAVPAVAEVNPSVAYVAAHDSSSEAQERATFLCDGHDDQVEIQQALFSVPVGGTVVLAAGTYNCSTMIIPKANTTLKGEGADSTFLRFSRTGRISVEQEGVTLDSFHIQGHQHSSSIKWLGVLTIYASHTKVHNITGTADASIQAVFLLLHNPPVYQPTLEDIEFVNCRVVDTGTYGFLHNAWGTENKVIKNVRYEDCQAINCGQFGAFNSWVTGFNFAELNDIENLRVNNCLAEGTLESGFHFEWDPRKHDCILTNCVSRDNGQKEYPTNSTLQYFGCGYYAPRGDITFIDCVSEGNSRNGFFTTNGGRLYNCVDRNVGAGRTDFRIIQPAAFYAVPSRSVNPSLIMENCSSIDANGYGLQVDLAKWVTIKNFELVNPAGINGRGANLGGTHGWLQNSSFEIYATGDKVDTLIWARENRDVTYSGTITSDRARLPFLIEGPGTWNVDVRGMQIMPKGAAGITLVNGARGNQVLMGNGD